MTRLRDAVDRWLRSRAFYWGVFAACLAPGAVLAVQFYQVITGTAPEVLGGDPSKTVLHTLGRYALGLLLITLSVTPIRRLAGLNGLQRVRRMLGVWSFTYATLHVSVYLVFDQLCYSWGTCRFSTIWTDFLKRKFTFVGLLAFTILLALALTSTNGWMRRLKKRWQTLHRLVYVAASAGVVHFVWGQKADIREPLRWAAILAVLLAVRVYLSVQKRRPFTRPSARSPRQSAR